jgi:dephospho-CoA kinase
MNRDGLPKNQVETIVNAQIDREGRLASADDILNNTGDKASLLEQVDALHQQYSHQAKAAGKL